MFVSLEEQKKRLTKRLQRPDKYWKYNPKDVDERLLWPKYLEAYQAMLERTSTDYAPWHVIPCDRKWYGRLAILELLIEALERTRLVLAASRFRRRRREEAARRKLAPALLDEGELPDVGDAAPEEVRAPGEVAHVAVVDLFGCQRDRPLLVGGEVGRPDVERLGVVRLQ